MTYSYVSALRGEVAVHKKLADRGSTSFGNLFTLAGHLELGAASRGQSGGHEVVIAPSHLELEE